MKHLAKMKGVEGIPEVERGILAGIAIELMELDPKLWACFFGIGVDATVHHPSQNAFGFDLKRRKVGFVKITLSETTVAASYRWSGRVTPQRPVPDKPGWVYPASKSNESGYWYCDVYDPLAFRKWVEQCEQYILARVAYLEERRAKVVAKREFRAEQLEIARKCCENSRARWAKMGC